MWMFMFKKTNLIFLSLVLSTQLSGAILTGNDGIKYITLGSTQDEVLKILGKPSCISCSGSYWEYGSDYLKFENGRVV